MMDSAIGSEVIAERRNSYYDFGFCLWEDVIQFVPLPSRSYIFISIMGYGQLQTGFMTGKILYLRIEYEVDVWNQK